MGAIVTDAGSIGDGVGTGKAIAALFAREGARLALLDLDHDRAAATARLIAARGGDATIVTGDVTGDVTDPHECHRMVKGSFAWLGRLDVLVNNVGLGAAAGRLDRVAPEEDWARGIELNLTSAFGMTRAAIPYLLDGIGKAIVNIASVSGIRAHGTSGYGPAKAAMIQFTREIAVMYGRDGVRANAIL